MRCGRRFLALLALVAGLLVLPGILLDLHIRRGSPSLNMRVDAAEFGGNCFHLSVSDHSGSGTSFHGFSYDIEEEYLYITVRKGLVSGNYRGSSMDVDIEDSRLEHVQTVYLKDGPEKKLICAR